MKETIDFKQQYFEVIEDALKYAKYTDNQITDAITELEGINWFESTDIYERA